MSVSAYGKWPDCCLYVCCGLIRSEAFQANSRQVDLMNKNWYDNFKVKFLNLRTFRGITFKLNMHLIDRIPEYEYAKVLLQISCTMVFGLLNCYIHEYFYFKQISSYCKAINAKMIE